MGDHKVSISTILLYRMIFRSEILSLLAILVSVVFYTSAEYTFMYAKNMIT